MITAELKGVNKLVNRLKKLGEEVAEDADRVIKLGTYAIEREAKRNIPTDTAGTKAMIYNKLRRLQGEVGVNSRIAPYIEFGTKSKVDVPPGLESYAMQFKSSGGNFAELLEAIEGWTSRKGIAPEFAYPIALKIARNGVSARPFLFPAYEKESPKIRKNLEKIVNERR